FILMRPPGAPPAGAPPGGAPGPAGEARVRRATPGEDPDVEVSVVEHLAQLERRWWPIPYQLSAPHAVQVQIARTGTARRGAQVRLLLAVDTTSASGSGGRHLDPAIDGGRPFRPLDKDELGGFLDHP